MHSPSIYHQTCIRLVALQSGYAVRPSDLERDRQPENCDNHLHIFLKSCFLILLWGLPVFAAIAQQKDTLLVNMNTAAKGNIALSQKKYNGVNRALVVGISQYQQIHGLEYADKDAEEFSGFLLNNPNWKIVQDHLLLLTNEKAKSGNIITSLTWLLEQSKEGDNVLFYFSGHGDVETAADIDKGFLLTYDCPKNNYITGALGVDVLQHIFTEMLEKGIRIYIVTDACRSGHLAGGAAGATQTAKAFSKQWKNETKILSSQPDEVSFEGRQWGNGRGVFSFFLIKGLNGLADLNNDSVVTLSELEQYVGLQVAEATNYKQQPVFEGASKFSSKISTTDTAGINRYQQWKSGTAMAVFIPKEKAGLGFPTDPMLNAYPSLLRLVNDSLVSTAIIDRAMLEYQIFKVSSKGSETQDHVRYQVTASLMNYLQQLVNQSLIGKTLVDKKTQLYALTLVDSIKAINEGFRLINRAHLDNIRRYFFINSIVWWNDVEGMQANKININSMLDTAFALEPKAAYLLTTKAMVFKMEGLIDSAVVYLQQAIQSSPTWLMPKYRLGMAMEEQGKLHEALRYYEEMMLLDTTYQTFECAQCFFVNMAEIYTQLKKYKEAEQAYLKAYAINSLSFETMEGLLALAIETKDEHKKNLWLEKLKQAAKTTTDKLNLLQLQLEHHLLKVKEAREQLETIETVVQTKEEQFLYAYTNGLAKEIFGLKYAADNYEEAYALNSYDFNVIRKLLGIYIEKGAFKVADQLVEESLPKFTGWRWQMIRYYQACSYAYNKREEEALPIFKELIQQNLVDCKEILTMKPLKNAPSFKDFLQSCR